MNIFKFFKSEKVEDSRHYRAQRVGDSIIVSDFTSADLDEFIKKGNETFSGEYVTASKALYNAALLRCVLLISESIGMLPLNLYENGAEKRLAKELPIYDLLKKQSNDWQTAYEFKALMQMHCLMYGNAYARIIRSRDRIIRLIPIHPNKIKPKQLSDWSLVYTYTTPQGSQIEIPAKDIFHLRDFSEDGVLGESRVEKAKEALGIAIAAQKAAGKLFKNGIMAGGALSTDNKLSDQAYDRLKKSVEEKKGADKAGDWWILEEGLDATKWANTAAEAQHIENRNHQIEEIARVFGVPRPLLMMDDTSWGSGIEQLGIFFVQYGLNHWFTNWEQAIVRSLLTDKEKDKYYAKFNERALLRGTLKDQAEFFTKALGSGGHRPWMTSNEIRDLQELGQSNEEGTDSLKNPLMERQSELNKTTRD